MPFCENHGVQKNDRFCEPNNSIFINSGNSGEKMKNYFAILGLPANERITEDDIKKAYRKLALIWHPDKNKDIKTSEKFKEINEAYRALLDPVARHALLAE